MTNANAAMRPHFARIANPRKLPAAPSAITCANSLEKPWHLRRHGAKTSYSSRRSSVYDVGGKPLVNRALSRSTHIGIDELQWNRAQRRDELVLGGAADDREE